MGTALLVLWAALGLEVAAGKGALGRTVEWIGCELVSKRKGGVYESQRGRDAVSYTHLTLPTILLV
eukprot:1612821-Amphidinium_carterae.1